MTTDVKKFLLIFGGGFLLFWLLKPGKKSQSKQIDKIKQRTDASNALTAFQNAVKAGESPEVIAELNDEIGRKYGLKILYVMANSTGPGYYSVKDISNGNEILRS